MKTEEIPSSLKTAALAIFAAKSKSAKTIKRRAFIHQCREQGLSGPWVIARVVAEEALTEKGQ